MGPNFSGWATKAGLKCSDGRTITPEAFKHMDGQKVPLVWQHDRTTPENVLGHAVLEHREDGTYAYCYFNDSPKAQHAKMMVEHEDVTSLSIYANQLIERSKSVYHGVIREVSLVIAGANPGALIDNVILAHSDGEKEPLDEAVIYTGLALEHEDQPTEKSVDETDKKEDDKKEDDKTVGDVYETFTDEQKDVVHFMIDAALKGEGTDAEHSAGNTDEDTLDHQEGSTMAPVVKNVFDKSDAPVADELRHSMTQDDLKNIFEEGVRTGSLKHAVEAYALQHGIENIDLLFPDAKTIQDRPEFDQRRVEWVAGVLAGTKHNPFSRIKTITADITQEEARAKGYIKGTYKEEEWFGLQKRLTTPATVYKKQKLDRDDILDITDFDVVAWLKIEMRMMLDEEIARAILVGDGRAVGDTDKVKDPIGATEGSGIRSIVNDHELFVTTVNVNLDDANSTPSEIVDAVVMAFEFYKGSGSPTFYTTQKQLSKLLLAKDTLGRRLYTSKAALADELGVANIVPVEVMGDTADLVGIIVNLSDYAVGTDKGGEVNWFDDFDIDYNKYTYLGETRLSGALTKIKSALVIKKVAAGAALVTPTEPTFVEATGVITIPTVTGVTYKRADTNATVAAGPMTALAAGASLGIYAVPTSGSYYFATNAEDSWTFDRDA